MKLVKLAVFSLVLISNLRLSQILNGLCNFPKSALGNNSKPKSTMEFGSMNLFGILARKRQDYSCEVFLILDGQ